MPQLNLASEVSRAYAVTRLRRLLYGVSFVLLLAIVGAWGLAALLTNSLQQKITTVGSQITTLNARLKAKRDEVRPIVLFLRRLSLLQEKLTQHVGWSGALAALEEATTPVASFRSLLGSAETGNVTAQVQVPSLDAAADLLASLTDTPGVHATPFRRVEVESMSIPESGVTAGGYLLSLRLTAPQTIFTIRPGEAPAAAASPASPEPAPR